MAGATSSFEGVLSDFPTPILPKIDREPTIEGLINLHQLISENAASVASNLGGGGQEHLAMTMTVEEYRSQTVFAFVPLHYTTLFRSILCNFAYGSFHRVCTGVQTYKPCEMIHQWG